MNRELKLMMGVDDSLLFAIGVKTSKCRYCDDPAEKNVSWNDGDSTVSVCSSHVAMAKNRAKMQDGTREPKVTNIGDGEKGMPKTETCGMDGCKEQATKRVIWADGRAYQPCCDGHVDAMKKYLTEKNTDAEIVGVRDIKAAGVDTDPDPSPDPGATELREYWVHGEGATKIKWGKGGDFNRCVTHLTKYVGTRAKGLCNVYHTAALGAAPGHGHGKSIMDRITGLGIEVKLDVPDIDPSLMMKVFEVTEVKALPKVPAKLRACKGEDDPGPCRWDAKKNGNGKGKSFTTVPDGKGGTVQFDDDGTAVSRGADGEITKKHSKEEVAKSSGGAAKKAVAKKPPAKAGAAKKAPAKKEPVKGSASGGSGAFESLHPRNADGTFAYKNDSGKGDAERGEKDKGAKDDGKAHGRIGEAQAALVKAGFLNAKDGRKGKAVDGYFGPKTQAALVKYQKANKLKPTGKLDAATQKALTAKKAPAKKAIAKKPVSKAVATKDFSFEFDGVTYQTKSAVSSTTTTNEGGTAVGAIEYKSVGVSGVKELGGDNSGLVEAIVSVTGIVDNVKDIIAPGAYAKSLVVRVPKGVWHHNWHESVSRTEAIKELPPGDADLPATLPDGKPWPREAGALKVTTRFNLETQRGREAYADVKFFGATQEWSIGYNVPVGGATIDSKTGVRTIETLDLFEYSPVLFGAMPVARTASVKSAQDVFATLLNAVPREELLLQTKDFLNHLTDDDSVVEGKAATPIDEEELDEEMEPGDEEDQGVEEEEMDEDDDEEEKPEGKAMAVSAGQGELVKKCIDALTALYASMSAPLAPPSEEMAEEKMRRKKKPGMGSTGCKSLEELVSAMFDDDAVVTSAKSFDEAVTSEDLEGMETAATAVLDAVEESIDGGEDPESFADLTDYIVESIKSAEGSGDEEEEDPEDAEEEAPEDEEEMEEEPEDEEKVRVTDTEIKSLLDGLLDY